MIYNMLDNIYLLAKRTHWHNVTKYHKTYGSFVKRQSKLIK